MRTRNGRGRASVGIALAAVAIGGLAGCGSGSDSGGSPPAATALETQASDDRPAEIVARGTGRIEGRPDVMTIRMGISTSAPVAAQALDQAAVLSTAMSKTLKENGVAEADLQTSDLSLWPEFDDKGRRITGYRVSTTYTARLRDLDRAGEVIDVAAKSVGDAVTMQGISFSIDDTGELLARARAGAVERAAAQAEQLAEAAGVRLGRIVSIEERRDEPADEYYGYRMSADAVNQVAIERGSQELTVDVDVVYELEQ